ncbi:hypothetical protein HYY75_08895, partial [bacterium]|nr:hypothetical protein [bacterium]
DSDVFGPEVNFASKLGEDTAKPYEILVTRSVKDEAKEIKRISFERIEDTPPGADEVFKLVFSLGADPKSQHTKPGKKSFRKAN